MKRLLIFTILLIAGCQQSMIRFSENDPNIPIEYRGKAADTIAEQIADNQKTATARVAETQKHNAWLYAGLVIAFVGGLVFWGFTRSRYGFVIPASCAVGLGLITAFAKFAEWIALGVLVIGLGLLIWKSVEYQRERNEIFKQRLGDSNYEN